MWGDASKINPICKDPLVLSLAHFSSSCCWPAGGGGGGGVACCSDGFCHRRSCSAGHDGHSFGENETSWPWRQRTKHLVINSGGISVDMQQVK